MSDSKIADHPGKGGCHTPGCDQQAQRVMDSFCCVPCIETEGKEHEDACQTVEQHGSVYVYRAEGALSDYTIDPFAGRREDVDGINIDMGEPEGLVGVEILDAEKVTVDGIVVWERHHD